MENLLTVIKKSRVPGPRLWPRAFLSLASSESVLKNSVLALDFFEFLALILALKVVSSTSSLLFTTKNIAGGILPCFSHLGQVTYNLTPKFKPLNVFWT